MEQYVIDTHSLLWYVSADSRIGNRAKLILEKAENGTVKIIFPIIVLIEAIDILHKKGTARNAATLLEWIEQIPQYEIKNLDHDILTLFKNYNSPVPKDIHDKIIIITAQYFGNIPIITKDTEIKQAYLLTIW